MQLHSAQTAFRRATKRFSHAVAALAKAESESARKRHGRRMINAQRGMAEAGRTVAALWMEGAHE